LVQFSAVLPDLLDIYFDLQFRKTYDIAEISAYRTNIEIF
jgi:hypothetical protein